MQLTTALAALAATLVAAHPGHDHSAEQAVRREFLSQHRTRGLDHCAEKLAMRGVTERSRLRRHEVAEHLREKRGLKKRGEHESDEDYTIETDPAVIFAEDTSCILSPEVTEGPYYVTGEYVRVDVTEDQPGVGLFTDIQVIDTATCEPVTGAYLEIWHCNSTGVYGGVTANGNGDSSDDSNLDATWLRGVQQTDADGVVQFQTLFPGHYTGRTTHIHVMVHLDATPFDNGTLIDTTAAHVGQMFFDQDLITSVEEVSPYSENTQTLTTNDQDGILQEESASGDPIVKYVLLGDTVDDGLLAWLSFGIDTTYSRTVSAAATHLEDGGHANEGSGGGPGGPPS